VPETRKWIKTIPCLCYYAVDVLMIAADETRFITRQVLALLARE